VSTPTTTPERTCIGCRSKRPQAALLRVVVVPTGAVIASRTAPGRGAWLCVPPSAADQSDAEITPEPGWSCLELAKKRRGFDRAFRRTLGDGALDELTAANCDES
jgi:predicted RNA-binding protein YlxR (DUF448 family)